MTEPARAVPPSMSDTLVAAHSTRFEYDGNIGTFFGLWFKNIVLTTATFGIYRFWAKTEVRQYLWSHTSVYGDRFEYTGTGIELLRGFFKAMLFIGGVSIVAAAAHFLGARVVAIAITLAANLFFASLVPLAQFSARRYRLSRTLWRGIRFGLTGNAKEFVWVAGRAWLMSLVTFGLLSAHASVATHRYLTDHTQFGSLSLKYEGQGSDLMGRFVVCLLLAVPTLGLSIVWYAGTQMIYHFNAIRIGPARLRVGITGGQWLRFYAVNFLLAVVTLGLATPFIIQRTAQFWFSNLSIDGELPFDAIMQNPNPIPKSGEGLADMMDVDMLSG